MRDIKPIIGYVHTGIEKTAEDKAYWKVIPVVERMDYLAYYFNAMAFCGAVETLLDLEVPPRAQYLRVIHLELNRIMSHLVWLGTSALDLGAISMFWYCFREREQILDLFEMSSGQRMHTRYIQVGGVFEDIPRGLRARSSREFTDDDARRASTSSPRCSTRTRSCSSACADVGAVDEQTLLGLGVTGPLLRATGNPWDLRKAAPVLALRPLRLQDPGRHGRRQLRPLSRAASPRSSESVQDHRAGARRACPRARTSPTNRKFALPPRHELATSMEALIHHFKLVTEGFRVPPGEVYYPIESPRGELGCFVRSDGSSKPARVHMRDPSFVNLQALKPMVAGPLHRRPDRDAGDARPDPRGDRPLMAIDPTPGHAARARLARPRLGRRGRPRRRTRRSSPTRRRRRCPTSCARRSRRYMAQYPDFRSAAIPALHAAQR